MSIGYENVQVTDELLKEYEEEKKKAEGWAKYGRFKAWLYYANLKRRQLQGLHENCLVGYSIDGIRQVHCICGLILQGDGPQKAELISEEAKKRTNSLKLDNIQIVKGHLSLDNFKTVTVALLVDFLWVPEIGDYLWTAYCQECGMQIKRVENSLAKKFVSSHNAACGGTNNEH